MNTEIIQECLRGAVAHTCGPFYNFYMKNEDSTIMGVTNLFMTNNKVELERISDAVSVDAISLTFNSSEDIKNFYEIIKEHNISFKIYAMSNTIQHLNVQLLIELNKPYVDNNTITIKIPNILKAIELIGLEHDKLFVSFDESNIIKNITEIKLYLTNYIYDTPKRKEIATKPTQRHLEEIIGGTLYKNIIYEKVNDTFLFNFNICSESYSKGFYILCSNIDDLVEIKFTTCKQNRLLYDKFCIQNYCMRISNNLLFVPFNPKYKNDDNILKTYTSCVDFSRYNQICYGYAPDSYWTRIIMLFAKEPTNIGIYLMSINIAKYEKGIIKLTNHNYLTIQQNKTNVFELNKQCKKTPGEIGFWKTNNPSNIYTDVPVENSAIEDQTEYINKLKDLQNEIHDGDLYLGYDHCVLCNNKLKLHIYKHKGLTWHESYMHYLEDHNIKMDNQLVEVLNDF